MIRGEEQKEFSNCSLLQTRYVRAFPNFSKGTAFVRRKSSISLSFVQQKEDKISCISASLFVLVINVLSGIRTGLIIFHSYLVLVLYKKFEKLVQQVSHPIPALKNFL